MSLPYFSGVVIARTSSSSQEPGTPIPAHALPQTGLGHTPPARLLDLSEPVLQPLIIGSPRDLRALRRLCFSSVNPSGMRPFDEVLIPWPLGMPRARLIANLPDSNAPTFRDPDGNPWVVRTSEGVEAFGDTSAARVQVVPTLGGWLREHITAPEPLTLGSDEQICGGGDEGSSSASDDQDRVAKGWRAGTPQAPGRGSRPRLGRAIGPGRGRTDPSGARVHCRAQRASAEVV